MSTRIRIALTPRAWISPGKDRCSLLHSPDGSILTVLGDLAEVHLDKLSILGPEVHIDQKENKAWVKGLGHAAAEHQQLPGREAGTGGAT